LPAGIWIQRDIRTGFEPHFLGSKHISILWLDFIAWKYKRRVQHRGNSHEKVIFLVDQRPFSENFGKAFSIRCDGFVSEMRLVLEFQVMIFC